MLIWKEGYVYFLSSSSFCTMCYWRKSLTQPQLAELKAPPVDVNTVLKGVLPDSTGGILGALLGETPSEAALRVEEARKGATDLSGMVRKKDKSKVEASPEVKTNGSNGKRKADEGESETKVKKVRIVEPKKVEVEDAPEE